MMTSLLNKQTYFRDCFVGEYPIFLKSLMKPMTWFVEVVCVLKYSRSQITAQEVKAKVDRRSTVPKINNLTEVEAGDSTLFLHSRSGEKYRLENCSYFIILFLVDVNG